MVLLKWVIKDDLWVSKGSIAIFACCGHEYVIRAVEIERIYKMENYKKREIFLSGKINHWLFFLWRAFFFFLQYVMLQINAVIIMV